MSLSAQMVQQVGMTTEACRWNPAELLDIENACMTYALLILNTPISHKRDLLLSLWKGAAVHVTVDGGTNRWHKFSVKDKCEKCSLPDMITGDFDSASPEVLKFYQAQGVDVIRTPDQNETDFTKALRQTSIYVKRNEIKLDAVIVIAEAAGRLDQIIANVNTLYKAKDILGEVPVFLLGRESLTWLLRPGTHCISVPARLAAARQWCSLMPFGASATVTTTGLKWNLENRVMQFGHLVSTSNTYSGSPLVTVLTDSCLVWSMGLDMVEEEDYQV